MKSILNVDYEWIYLMAKAKENGYTVEEVRAFLEKHQIKECAK